MNGFPGDLSSCLLIIAYWLSFSSQLQFRFIIILCQCLFLHLGCCTEVEFKLQLEQTTTRATPVMCNTRIRVCLRLDYYISNCEKLKDGSWVSKARHATSSVGHLG